MGQPSNESTASAVQSHADTNGALALGIIGVVACGLTAPFALRRSARILKEMGDDSFRDRGAARAAWVLGIVGSVGLALTIVLGVIGGLIAFRSAQASNNERQEARDCAREARYMIDQVENYHTVYGEWPRTIAEINAVAGSNPDPLSTVTVGTVEPEWLTLSGDGTSPPTISGAGTRCEDADLPQPG